MAMAVDQRQPQGLGYSHMRYPPAPHFTNPWSSAGSPTTSGPMYSNSMATSMAAPSQVQQPAVTTMGYSAAHVAPAPLATDAMQRPFGSAFSQPDASAPTYAHAGLPQQYGYSQDRRPSQTIHAQTSQAQRDSFSDAVDASRGMLAMSQDTTPRNIYGNPNPRNSTDSYGFPSTHSAHSSISSASTYPSYYNGSVGDSSVTDYSSASEMGDLTSRTLPRPSGLAGVTLPPAPQSMMGQFSSKVSSSSQKKHKCKICDKRFTRPSSLQTHMYSHTGEKPFACDVEGCGRHFSVVSNLRRHKKVHKGERENNSGDDE